MSGAEYDQVLKHLCSLSWEERYRLEDASRVILKREFARFDALRYMLEAVKAQQQVDRCKIKLPEGWPLPRTQDQYDAMLDERPEG